MNGLRPLERIRYWQGQLLAAGDLRAQVASDLELRRLHNRSVHQAHGIAGGFTVTFDAAGASVTCGLAYDCGGRSLVSLRTRTVPFPPLDTQPIVLIAAYGRLEPDEVALAWKGRYDLQPCVGVALARAVPKVGVWIPDTAFQPVAARPIARPRLAGGQTVPGDTPWKAWIDPDTGTTLGIETLVDTRQAGFNVHPRYFASAVRDTPSARFANAWFQSLSDSSPQGFTLRLFLRGIERERLAIIAALGLVTSNPGAATTLDVDDSSGFFKFDLVSRLAPRMRDYALVDKVKSNVITLKSPLAGTPTQLAAACMPKTAVVQSTPAAAAGFEVEVADPDKFHINDVVVRTGDKPETSKPAKIIDQDDDGTLVLSGRIDGLEGDHLGVAVPTGIVQTVVGTAPMVITVDDPTKFHVNDIVVRLGTSVETSAPATIVSIDPVNPGDPPTLITLSAPIPGFDPGKSSLGVASHPVAVEKVFDELGESKVPVDPKGMFAVGDLVVRQATPLSDPVRVQRISANSKTIVISTPIPSLEGMDTMMGAIFRVRQTVQDVLLSGGKQLVTVTSPAEFPKLAFVARVDENLAASLPSSVADNTGSILTLNSPIAGLQAGDVIALAEFPPTVKISAFDPASNRVTMATAGFKAGDVVASPERSQASTVASVEGPVSLVLTDPIKDLTHGDTLSVVAMRRVLNVTGPGAGPNQVKVDNAGGIRQGDLAGPLLGFLGVNQEPQFVAGTSGGKIGFSRLMDGALAGDAIGSTDILPDRCLLRLKSMPALSPGDSVTVSGRDALTGRTITSTGVIFFQQDPFIALEFPGDIQFSLRPESITASVPFTGNPNDFAAAARKEGLYVEWFGCEEQTRHPFDCNRPVTAPADCGCEGGIHFRSGNHG